MQANKHVLYKIYRKKQQRKPSKTEDFQFVESQSKFFSEKKKKDFGSAQMKVERFLSFYLISFCHLDRPYPSQNKTKPLAKQNRTNLFRHASEKSSTAKELSSL